MNKYMMRCALNGVDLYTLSDRIYIQDIEEKPEVKINTIARPYYGLSASGSMAHDSMTVKITFMIKEKNRVFRAAILQKICAWATKGYLTTSTRLNQRAYVWCTELPEMRTFVWHEDMTITFTAYGEGCWEDTEPITHTISGETLAELETFNVRGTLPCFLEADITNTSGETLTAITLSANGQSIVLSGLSIANETRVEIRYDEQHYLCISSGDTSLLDHRTGADDLILYPGPNNQISCATDVECSTTFKARGMYR